MAHWYYRVRQNLEIGPIGSRELLELIRNGEVKSHTQVRKDDSQWVQACEVNGLWQAVGLPSVLFHCPFCDGNIDKPPSRCPNCRKEIAKAVGELVKHSRPKDVGWSDVPATKTIKVPPLQ